MTTRRRAFTLFEVILAIALSATLLALIGTAINLYLMRVDAGRTRVEEAQLARNILAMIAGDIRAATIYKPQDTAAIAQIMASAQSQRGNDGQGSGSGGDGPGGSLGGTGGTGGASSTGAPAGGSDSSNDGDNPNNEGDNNSDNSDSSSNDANTLGALPLGLNGTLNELYIDVTRLPRRDELFSTTTGYTNAPMPIPSGPTIAASTSALTAVVPPTDLNTVRYYLRPGDTPDAASAAVTSLAPEAQVRLGGLVRQQVPRPLRTFAERSGNAALLDTGHTLIAPEVVHLEFRYYDGQRVTESWDMREASALPVAVEVRIWLLSPDANQSDDGLPYDRTTMIQNAHEYRQTVSLPMALLDNSSPAGPSNNSSSSSGGMSSDSQQR